MVPFGLRIGSAGYGCCACGEESVRFRSLKRNLTPSYGFEPSLRAEATWKCESGSCDRGNVAERRRMLEWTMSVSGARGVGEGLEYQIRAGSEGQRM